MSVIKLSTIYYSEANDSESGLPKTLTLLMCNVKASFSSLSPLWTILEIKKKLYGCIYFFKMLVIKKKIPCFI